MKENKVPDSHREKCSDFLITTATSNRWKQDPEAEDTLPADSAAAAAKSRSKDLPIVTREEHATPTRPSTRAEAQHHKASPPPSRRKQGQQTYGGAALFS
ncbi:hypothetical protein NDU88_003315 [Pleurodeles waltl]|uniref:Uncharacterized protein n=1 Tax=Pleurodeles waltl TaxID=8319 RepID=A0AAV7KY59_PLEWA|nr:hypothetical protein NDU88_003315 [Pleurodeles waltl]